MARVIFLVPSPPSHLFYPHYCISHKAKKDLIVVITMEGHLELSVLSSKVVNKNLHFLDSMQVHTYLSSFTA